MKLRRTFPFQRLFPLNVSGMRLWPVLVAALWAGSAQAAQPTVAAQLKQVRNHVTEAVLYIGPTSWSFNTAREEEDLPSISCHYVLTTPDDLWKLMDILDRAKVVADKPPTILNARIGIYLHQDNGAVSKLILANPFKDEGARGLYNDGTGVVTSVDFAQALRAFARTLQQTKPNWYCDGEKAAASEPRTGKEAK